MDELIRLIIYVVVFAIVIYGSFYVMDRSQMPRPVYWLVGALFLIILLLFPASRIGVSNAIPIR